MSPASTDVELVDEAHALALDLFRAHYPEVGLAPSTKLYDSLPRAAFPSWNATCHVYKKLLGIDVEEALANLRGTESHE